MKKMYLLDTNIVSEFSKERPNDNVIAFYKLRKDLCALSAVTWQELSRGVYKMPEGKKKRYLEKCLTDKKVVCFNTPKYHRASAQEIFNFFEKYKDSTL